MFSLRLGAYGCARLTILLGLAASICIPSARAQSRAIAFTNVTLIDGTGAAPRAGLTVVIR